jgi:hypothetical protein
MTNDTSGNIEASKYNQVSRTEVKQKIKSGLLVLKQGYKILIVACIIGASLGFLFAKYNRAEYIATSTFVLEEKSGGGGISSYAGIASQLGISLGSEGGGGLFHGDNIIELYKSRTMLQKTLLTPIMVNGKKQLLIDRYIETESLRKDWQTDPKLKNISFDEKNFTIQHDSIISSIVNKLKKKNLNVFKPDKKLTIINVTVTFADQVFAKFFNEKLVENVNQFYTVTKTKKSTQNVAIFKFKGDSVRRLLNQSLSGVASALDAAPNANPFNQILKVPSQRRQIDVQTNAALYTEIIKNMAIAEITMRQETPLIQIIDEPTLPLEAKKIGVFKGIVLGIFLSLFLTIGFMIIRKITF